MRLLLILITLWGANAFAIEGKIIATESIFLNVVKGEKSFGPGEFTAKLDNAKKNELRLEVMLAGKNNNPVALFKVPTGKKIPRANGNLNLTAEESGQPYDLNANWNTEVEETNIQWRHETCRYVVYERYCRIDSNGRQVCQARERWLNGWRDVRYYDRFFETLVTAELQDPQQGNALGNFSATALASQRIYVYEGICR